MKAASYITRGSTFYVTNEDAVLPCADYCMPGWFLFHENNFKGFYFKIY